MSLDFWIFDQQTKTSKHHQQRKKNKTTKKKRRKNVIKNGSKINKLPMKRVRGGSVVYNRNMPGDKNNKDNHQRHYIFNFTLYEQSKKI